MLSSLSIKQRAAFLLMLLAAGPACVAFGTSSGWSASALIGSSAGFAALAAVAFIGSLGVLKSFLGELSTAAKRLASGDLSVDIDTHANGNPDAAIAMRAL